MKLFAPIITLLALIIIFGCSSYKSPSGTKRNSLGRNTDLEIIKNGTGEFYLAVGQNESRSYSRTMDTILGGIGIWGLTDIFRTVAGVKVAEDAAQADVLLGRQKADVAERAIEADVIKKTTLINKLP